MRHLQIARENVAGTLCYALLWVSGLVFLIVERDSGFVRFHAMQSVIAFGAISIGMVVASFLPVIGGLIDSLLGLLLLVVWVLTMVKAWKGERFKLPWAGDEAEKIGFLASKLAAMDRPSDSYRELKTLGQHVAHMLRDAMNAFARLDVEEAWDVVREDERVDEEYEAIQRQGITFMMEDPRSIKRVMNVAWCARSLERIGDHAKNIARHYVYYARGDNVSHVKAKDLRDAAGLSRSGDSTTEESAHK